MFILSWTQYASNAGHENARYLRMNHTPAGVRALRHTRSMLLLKHVLTPLLRVKRLSIFLSKDLCGCDRQICQAWESTALLMPPRGCTKGASLLPAVWKGKLTL